MTLQEIIDLKTSLLNYDLDDRDGEAPTTAQQVASVNWAIRQVSWRIFQYDPSIVFTLTADQAAYDLRSTSVVSRKVIRPFQVVINGTTLSNARRNDYGLWTFGELDAYYPGWRTDASGQPIAAVHQGTKLYLTPKPSAAVVSAGSNYIAGQYMAADMTVGQLASSPDIPEELHEVIAFYAAEKASRPYVDGEQAWARLGDYASQWQAQVLEVRRENLRQFQNWGSIETGGSDTLWL